MKYRCNCICGDVGFVLLASLGLSLGFAGQSMGQCTNDVGSGDLAPPQEKNLTESGDSFFALYQRGNTPT